MYFLNAKLQCKILMFLTLTFTAPHLKGDGLTFYHQTTHPKIMLKLKDATSILVHKASTLAGSREGHHTKGV